MVKHVLLLLLFTTSQNQILASNIPFISIEDHGTPPLGPTPEPSPVPSPINTPTK